VPERLIPARYVRRFLLALVATGLGISATATVGFAATYKMYTCNVPGIPTPATSASPWTWTLDGRYTQPFDNCLAGGGFGVGFPPGLQTMSPSTSASLVLRRPATGPKAAIGIVRYRTWLVANLAGSGAPAFISDGGAFSPPGGANTDGDPWTSPQLDISNEAVYVQLYCSTGAPADCSFASTKPLIARGIEVELFETVLPKGTIGGGTLLTGAVASGKQTLSYSASDLESGVARVEALLGSTVAGTEDFATNPTTCPHRAFSACASDQSGSIAVDTALVPDGAYALGIRITDAAGNQTTVRGSTLAIRNAGAPVAPMSASAGAHLNATFRASGRRTYTAAFGRVVAVGGRLTDRQGAPIPNADVQVHERQTRTGARLVQAPSLRTDASGHFLYRLPRRTTSRTIQLSYQAGGAVSASQSLTLKVRSAARIRVSLRGVMVRYGGVVKTTPLPGGGKTVLMQGRAPGTAWQTFAIRRTDRFGRFAGRYRLRVRRPGVRLQFRLKVPAEAGYPYAAGASPVLKRTVR
jgi:hypothetical protein